MSILEPELQKAYDEGLECGRRNQYGVDLNPYSRLEEPGQHTAWLNGFAIARSEE